MSRYAAGLCAMCAIMLTGATTWAAPTADEILKKMTDREMSLKTMQADVVIMTDAGQGRPTNASGQTTTASVEVEGKVVLKMCQVTKSKMKIGDEIVTTEIKIVDDGQFVWQEAREPGMPLPAVMKNRSEGNGTVGLIKKNFGFTSVGEDTIGRSKMYVLEGRTKPLAGMPDSPETASKVKCFVDQETMIPMRVAIYRPDGKEFYRFELENVKLNEKVDMKMFEYTPPEGVVVDDRTKEAAAEEKQK